MSWWVGGYIEEGMGTGTGSGTAYLPFVFSAGSKAQAAQGAGAKLLAGPFTTQGGAQSWANAYEKNPGTLHAGNDLSPSNSVVKGDTAPAGAGTAASILQGLGDFIGRLEEASTWERIAEVLIGVALIGVGVAHLLNVKLPSAVPVPV